MDTINFFCCCGFLLLEVVVAGVEIEADFIAAAAIALFQDDQFYPAHTGGLGFVGVEVRRTHALQLQPD